MKKTLANLGTAILIGILLGGILSGCASIQQAVDAYGSVAVDTVKRANDTAIAAWSTAACATPVGALSRNPQVIPAVRSLCLRPGDTAVAELLDTIERHTLQPPSAQ